MDNLDFSLHIDGKRFLQYMELSPVGYLILNQEGIILDINQVLLKSSQYSKEALLYQSYENIICFHGTRDDFIEKLDSFSQEGEIQLLWKDLAGHTQYSKVLVCKTVEPTLYILGFLEIRMEKHTTLLSQFAENFVSEVHIGIIVINNELKIKEISPLSCKILNVSKEDVLNLSIDELFIGVGDEHRIVQRALLEGITVTNHAFTWNNHQQRYDLLLDSNVIKDDEGKVVGAYVVFKDVTNLRSLEQQVLQNDRLATIGQVAAGTAHEIRNPLTSIKGFLQILKSSLSLNGLSDELQYTDIMLSEIDRINKLVNEILMLSKPNNMVYKSLDINGIIIEILPIIQNESLLHGIEVQHQMDHTLPLVIADSELLKQVFLNIGKNGIEAMNDEGTLTITTKNNRENKYVEVHIHDTGPGIPYYIADKIFEPFFTTKDTGTGLGLSISQKIIHDLGGVIRVSTKGFGTTFQIYFPYK